MEQESLVLEEKQRFTISRNLTMLIRLKKTSEARVAQDLNIPTMTIRRLLSGETTDPRISTLKTIASYFNISMDALVGSEQLMPQAINQPSKPIFIPVFDWDNVNNKETIDLNQWKNWIPVSVRNDTQISNKAFALESRPSMYPPFQPGTIFLLDPELKPSDGDLVLVHLFVNSEVTLRILSIDPPDWHLRSVSQHSNVLNFSQDEHKIIAVVFLTLFYNRKMYPI